MATPTKFGALRGTKNTAFSSQTVSAVSLGNITTTGSIMSSSLSLLDNPSSRMPNTGPREFSSGTHIYMTKKALSSGTFAYNGNTFVIARVSTTLSGVSKTNLVFMGVGAVNERAILEYKHNVGVKYLTAWKAGRITYTGKLADGTARGSRLIWLNADGTAVSAPSTLSTTYPFDIAAGTATGVVNDTAARPTRAIPGRLVMLADFVKKTRATSSGNFYYYKAITGM